MTILFWNKCNGDNWCPFERVELDHDLFTGMAGVYVIWYAAGSNPKAVRVGQGNIADRIAAHRRDPQIMTYATRSLYVTWAKVPAAQQNGIGRCKKLSVISSLTAPSQPLRGRWSNGERSEPSATDPAGVENRKLVVVGGPRGACVGVFDKKHPTQAHPWPTQKTLTS